MKWTPKVTALVGFVAASSLLAVMFQNMGTTKSNSATKTPFVGKVGIGYQLIDCRDYSQQSNRYSAIQIRETVGRQNDLGMQLNFSNQRVEQDAKYNWSDWETFFKYGAGEDGATGGRNSLKVSEPAYFDLEKGQYVHGFCTAPDIARYKSDLRMFAYLGVDYLVLDATNHFYRSTAPSGKGQLAVSNNSLDPFNSIERPFSVFLEAYLSLQKSGIALPKLIPWIPAGDLVSPSGQATYHHTLAAFFKEEVDRQLLQANSQGFKVRTIQDVLYFESEAVAPLLLLADGLDPKKNQSHNPSLDGYEDFLDEELNPFWDVKLMWANSLESRNSSNSVAQAYAQKRKSTQPDYTFPSAERWNHTTINSIIGNFAENFVNSTVRPTRAVLAFAINGNSTNNIGRNRGMTLLTQAQQLQEMIGTEQGRNVQDIFIFPWSYIESPFFCWKPDPKNPSSEIFSKTGCDDPNKLIYQDEFDLEHSRSVAPNVYTGHYYYNLLKSVIDRLKTGESISSLNTHITMADPLKPRGRITRTSYDTNLKQYFVEGWACLKGSEQPAIVELSVQKADGTPYVFTRRRINLHTEAIPLGTADSDRQEILNNCNVSVFNGLKFSTQRMWKFKIRIPHGGGLGGSPLIAKVIAPFHRNHLFNKTSPSGEKIYDPDKYPYLKSGETEAFSTDVEMISSGTFPIPGLIGGATKSGVVLCTPLKFYGSGQERKQCAQDGMRWL